MGRAVRGHLDSSRPITPTQSYLIAVYVLYALARQIARDLRTIWRLTQP